MAEIMINGYRRKNGFGVRNYVLIISTVQCVNTAAAQIAAATGAIPITHDFGCEEGAEGKSTHSSPSLKRRSIQMFMAV